MALASVSFGLAIFVVGPSAPATAASDSPQVVAQAGDKKGEAAADPMNAPSSPGFVGTTNSPEEFATGYESWGVNGGATLGHGNGLRAHLGVRGSPYGVIAFNPEAFFIFGLSEDFNLGVGGYLGFIGWLGGFGLALAPEALVRYRLMGAGEPFQLAVEATAGPLFWVGTLPGIGVQAVPGATASYFIKDNMEIYFGALVPFSILALTSFGVANWSLALDLRGGFAFTLKTANVGFFAQVDVLVGGAATNIGRRIATGVFGTAYGNVGVQWRFE